MSARTDGPATVRTPGVSFQYQLSDLPVDLTADADDVDWVLVEQCFQFDECDQATPFIERDKAVFVVEYEVDPADICDRVADGVSVVFKDLDLGPERATCPPRN